VHRYGGYRSGNSKDERKNDSVVSGRYKFAYSKLR
jgi:hypothetical protein